MKKCKYLIVLICINLNMNCQTTINYYGILSAHKLEAKSSSGTITYTNNTIDAIFSQTPKPNIPLAAGTKAGTVKFNNKKVKFEDNDRCPSKSHNGFYASDFGYEDDDDDECELNFSNLEWKIGGKLLIPNFLYNNTKPFPSFTVVNGLPDTIRKTDTLIVNFIDVLNADSISVYITDKKPSGAKHIKVITTANSPYIYVMPILLAPLNLSSTAIISINAINYTTVNVSGKKFLFRNEYEYFASKIRIIN